MKRAFITLVVLAALGAAGYYYYVRRSGPEISVSTAQVTRGDLVDAVASTGTLQAVISVNVGSQVSGNIAWLGADFNSLVKKDQVIARLDPTLFDAAVAQSTANLSNAQAQQAKDKVTQQYAKVTLDRNTDLRQRGIVTQDALDAAKTAYDQATAQVQLDSSQIDQAKAQLATSRTNLEHTIITSPIDGIVTQRSVDVGQTVQASMTAPTLFIIAADLTKMQVSASVDESDVGRVRPGQTVTFRVDAYPGEEFHGTVSQIRLNPIVVNNVTTYATMIDVPNTEFRLKPGMTANLKIQVAKRTDVTRVPNSALRFRPTTDMFAALNQPVPPEVVGGGRGGRGGFGQGGGGNRAGFDQRGGNGANANAPAAAGTPAAPGAAGRGKGDHAEEGAPGAPGSPSDRQAQMMERYKKMSPDEQKQFIERLKARGIDTSAFEKPAPGKSKSLKAIAAAKPGAAAGNESIFQPRYGAPQSAEAIAALFPAMPQVETRGRVWVFENHQLKSISVRLGITDGTNTELLSGELQPGTDAVIGITGLGSTRNTGGAATTGNPLLPQRGGPGGFPGGGPQRGR